MMPVYRVVAAVIATIPHCLFLGCREADPLETVSGELAARVAAEDVVARVDGEAISAADIRHQLKSHGDRRRALREAIRFELLAQEARRRALHRDPAVKRLRKRALANLFVLRAFGERFTKESIPERLVKRAYDLNWQIYDRPDTVVMDNLLVNVSGDAPVEKRRAARKLAARAHALLAAKKKVEVSDVDRVAAKVRQEGKAHGIPVMVERIAADRLEGPKKAVMDAAFALRPGQVSAPVRTSFGYYIVSCRERHAAVHRPLSAVEGEIRERIFEEARLIVFEEFVERLQRSWRVRTHPEALRLLADRREGSGDGLR